jgi:hypothetical protein
LHYTPKSLRVIELTFILCAYLLYYYSRTTVCALHRTPLTTFTASGLTSPNTAVNRPSSPCTSIRILPYPFTSQHTPFAVPLLLNQHLPDRPSKTFQIDLNPIRPLLRTLLFSRTYRPGCQRYTTNRLPNMTVFDDLLLLRNSPFKQRTLYRPLTNTLLTYRLSPNILLAIYLLSDPPFRSICQIDLSHFTSPFRLPNRSLTFRRFESAFRLHLLLHLPLHLPKSTFQTQLPHPPITSILSIGNSYPHSPSQIHLSNPPSQILCNHRISTSRINRS